MNMKFIPIIGTISAGKTTFLRAFLGTDVLQVGSVTTTKFACLIKNSTKTSFYHVLPKFEKALFFEKEGEEIIGEENIKNKIIEINTRLKEKKGTSNDIFYMLETPIKNIENVSLLENCYFMDIPGLNENESNYIEDIFSFVKLENILFEIVVFDSTSIGSDNILNIFIELENKNCLCKSNNIFILNKIDQCTAGNEDNIIESFKKYFYETFEDEKNQKRLINLNIYDNHFIPMNSILYRAESKLREDFCSLLTFELFNFLENDDEKGSSFFEYLQKRINVIINHENIDINKDIKNINEKEFKDILTDSITKLKNTIKNLKNSTEIQLGLNLNKKSVEKELKKLYMIQKLNKYIPFHSEFYIQLQEVIKNITVNNDDLSSPPIISDKNKIEIKSSNQKKKIKDKIEKSKDIDIIDDLDNFLKETFKEIDPQNELEEFKNSLQILRENILGRKIRISLIGNISVGKSSVLNCIIGSEILPTKDTECTYRGVILRHREIDEFELYRTKLITRGSGLDEYYYFIDESKWHCKGIQAIKDYLNNKNNDKNIGDEDAYIVIVGRLKIFDFIEIDKDIINKIEFIDLPGPDRKNNTFNDKKYYQKILKFSNCCIYMNEPKTIEDKNSVQRMIEQYSSDKAKVFPTLRKNFIKTCLFLINKSDTLENEDEKEEIVNNLIRIIQKEENDLKKEELNFSFFSGKYFLYYLDIYNQYVTQLNENPIKLLKKIYKDWDRLIVLSTFKNFIIKRIEKILEKFDFDSEEKIEVPEDFKTSLSSAFDKLFKGKYRSTTEDEEDEIIEKLYLLNKQLIETDLSDTFYSYVFFDKLKEVILFSEKFQNENLKISILEFFTNTDELFNKEIKKENENEKKLKLEECKFFKKEIIPQILMKFKEKKSTILSIYDFGHFRCNELIDNEIKHSEEIIKNSNNDVENASKNFSQKIDKIISELNENKSRELQYLITDIENILKQGTQKFKSKMDFKSTKIETNSGFTGKFFFSIVASVFSGVAIRSGVMMASEYIAAVAATSIAGGAEIGTLMGPIGTGIGIGVGIAISVVTMLSYYFSKSKRYKSGLEQTKKDIGKKFEELKNNFNNDFLTFEHTVKKQLKLKLETQRADVNSINEDKWKTIKENYQIKKSSIEKKINLLQKNN